MLSFSGHDTEKKRRFCLWICLTFWLCRPFAEGFQAIVSQSSPLRNRYLCSLSSTDNDDPQVSSVPSLSTTDNAPSWEFLQNQVLETPTGARLHAELAERARGLGPPHTNALLRLFPDNPVSEKIQNDGDESPNVRVTLYRDQAGWCPYCQKVWLFLELKSIPYAVRKVPMNAYSDKPAWYTRKVDGGKLPAMEIDGELYVESLDIMHLLEQTFPNHGPSMIPTEKHDTKKRFDALLSLEQELQRAWFSLVFYPVKGEALQSANQTFLETLVRVDDELSGTEGPWFLGGNAPSLVDLQYITQMERIIPSVLYWKGLDIRNTDSFPHLDRWLSAFEELPFYIASRSDYYTHVMVMPSQNGPGFMIPQAKNVSLQICGLSGGSWHLPLNLEDSVEHFPEPSFWGSSKNNAYNSAHEAAFQLVNNHANITRFACRGAGDPGRPAFHAELADPYAEPNEDYFEAVDICLRHVAHAMLEGIHDDSSLVEDAQKDLGGMYGNDELRENWEAYPDEDDPSLTYYWNYETGDVTWTPPTQQLDTCLTYLRDRIGVPRDMGPAAAMHLRAYLNWAIELTTTVKSSTVQENEDGVISSC